MVVQPQLIDFRSVHIAQLLYIEISIERAKQSNTINTIAHKEVYNTSTPHSSYEWRAEEWKAILIYTSPMDLVKRFYFRLHMQMRYKKENGKIAWKWMNWFYWKFVRKRFSYKLIDSSRKHFDKSNPSLCENKLVFIICAWYKSIIKSGTRTPLCFDIWKLMSVLIELLCFLTRYTCYYFVVIGRAIPIYSNTQTYYYIGCVAYVNFITYFLV